MQVSKVPALLVHVDSTEPVGIVVTPAFVDATVIVVPALALAAERETDCAASVGPKPKQAVAMGSVADYKASVLSR